MAYIYKITNDINNKVYIGQTSIPIKTRFKQHLFDSNKEEEKSRPLYRAMNKYGSEHFTISLIEETSDPNTREQYWIDFYDSYSNGYNASKGGEGILLFFTKPEEIELLISKFNIGYSLIELSNLFGCCTDTIRYKLRSLGFNTNRPHNNAKRRAVKQLDKDTGQVLAIYDSPIDAARSLGNERKRSHILEVLKKQRKTAYGYRWEYLEE